MCVLTVQKEYKNNLFLLRIFIFLFIYENTRSTTHLGVDIRANFYDPIYAPGSGSIENISYSSSYGEFVIIRFDDESAILFSGFDTLNISIGDTKLNYPFELCKCKNNIKIACKFSASLYRLFVNISSESKFRI